MLRALQKGLFTLRLALPKVAVGWMFALLTIDFNRVAIVELGLAAVLVATLLSIHYFLAPFQVFAGRIADLRPVFGFRRSPYLLGASLVASLLFLALPSVTLAMGAGVPIATPIAVVLFVVFGLCMAVIADSYHSLIAETTAKEDRASVISVVWVVMILSTIFAAVVMNAVRPEFSPEAMQNLYNLTPPIVMISVLVGIVGVEKRMNPAEIRAAVSKARSLVPSGNPIQAAGRLLGANRQARLFFMFIVFAIFALFLQESLIEVFGAEVFGADIQATTKYQPIWGAGILLGMITMGVVSRWRKISRKTLTLVGCAAAAVGFFGLGIVALTRAEGLLLPTLFVMGICAGVFNVGALAMMMDMTVDGATGMYMGMWGIAQAMGMGGSAVVGGAIHTSFIESGILSPTMGYWMVFSMEGGLLIAAAVILSRVSVDAFQEQASKVRVEHDMGSEADVIDAATARA